MKLVMIKYNAGNTRSLQYALQRLGIDPVISDDAEEILTADKIIFPYDPKMIFLRAGGNDIHSGKSPENVFNDFKDFVAKVRSKFPTVPIAYIAQSPSPARWNEREAGDKLNKYVAEYIQSNKNLVFVDDAKISLDASGQVRPELFVEDRLHFNEAGYKLLAEAVRPHLPK
jgi:lysophospholipase L1-like esterase